MAFGPVLTRKMIIGRKASTFKTSFSSKKPENDLNERCCNIQNWTFTIFDEYLLSFKIDDFFVRDVTDEYNESNV